MIIVLNGSSSAGKSSIAQAIKEISDKMWIQIGIDEFIDMIHSKFWGFGEQAEEGFKFVQNKDESGSFITDIHVGASGKKLSRCIPQTVKILAENGLDVIVDECLFNLSLM